MLWGLRVCRKAVREGREVVGEDCERKKTSGYVVVAGCGPKEELSLDVFFCRLLSDSANDFGCYLAVPV